MPNDYGRLTALVAALLLQLLAAILDLFAEY